MLVSMLPYKVIFKILIKKNSLGSEATNTLHLLSTIWLSTFYLWHFTMKLGFAGERGILQHECKERRDQGLQGRKIHVELMFIQPMFSFLKQKEVKAHFSLLKLRIYDALPFCGK